MVRALLHEELGETMSDEELQEMIREADKDDDGEVPLSVLVVLALFKECLGYCRNGRLKFSEVSEEEFMRIIRRPDA